MKISIIIPVYNASATLPACLTSLESQTYKEVEWLFVDDSSTDESLNILKTYQKRHPELANIIKILHHEHNHGVAAARNTALEHATGEYVYYVDADDTLCPDAVESMVNEAHATDSDIVGIEWYLTFKSNQRYMKQADYTTPIEALQNMMCGVMRWNLWLFLVKRSLYIKNDIRFTEGMDMGEDMMVMTKLFVCAKKVSLIHRPLYQYRQNNENSLTKTYSQEHIRQVTHNVYEAEWFIQNSSYAVTLSSYTPFLKLNIKLPLLITDNIMHYKQWLAWFPEANAYAMRNRRLPLRTRLIQRAATLRYFGLLRLYYCFVFKFRYGIIYK